MAYGPEREPITIFLRKGGKDQLEKKWRNSTAKSRNEYVDQMLIDGKLKKNGKA